MIELELAAADLLDLDPRDSPRFDEAEESVLSGLPEHLSVAHAERALGELRAAGHEDAEPDL